MRSKADRSKDIRMIPAPLKSYLMENNYGPVTASRMLGGGCISDAKVLTTQSGATFFVKTNPNIPLDMFAREAEGLAALQIENGVAIPEVHLFGADFILLEDLAPAPLSPDYWSLFGRQLAAQHNYTNPQFGFAHDNYIGSTPQPNPWIDDGYHFFSQHRFLFQANRAHKRGLLGNNEIRKVESIVHRLKDLIPFQPASLLHGDLWSGNIISNSSGAPAIIDPAVYFGWAEADLAMTTLFGTLPTQFYNAYEEIRPLDPGYHARFPIYNLYHLLNHLNIFGRGYLGQVQSILRRYS